MVVTNEAALTSAIIANLRARGVMCWRHNAGMTRGNHPAGLGTGTSDIVGIMRPTGRWLALEVKMPGKERTATDEQLAFLKGIADAGGVSAVVTSVDDAVRLAR